MFTLSTSLSLGILGAVLLFRKFDVYYGSLCLIAAALGYLYPILLILPYFVVVWRVSLGRHIQTDAKLLIGQHRRYEQAENHSTNTLDPTLAHWIVAIQPENSNTCLVTHAVGEVVSGLGKRLPWKERDSVENDYILHHVGWVTRKEREKHMQQVQEEEPLASGYSCQEFAVDIAFQISCSRTYTFFKSLKIVRLRTTIYMVFVCFSVLVLLLRELTNQPVIVFVTINPYLVNPVMITNIFVAMEAYRLGYTNRRQEKYWLNGLKDRLNVYFKINKMDKFKLIALLVFSVTVQILVNNPWVTIFILMIAIYLSIV